PCAAAPRAPLVPARRAMPRSVPASPRPQRHAPASLPLPLLRRPAAQQFRSASPRPRQHDPASLPLPLLRRPAAQQFRSASPPPRRRAPAHLAPRSEELPRAPPTRLAPLVGPLGVRRRDAIVLRAASRARRAPPATRLPRAQTRREPHVRGRARRFARAPPRSPQQ